MEGNMIVYGSQCVCPVHETYEVYPKVSGLSR